MVVLQAILYELEAFPDEYSLRRYSASVDMAACARDTQWLEEGMTNEQVETRFESRTRERSSKGTFITLLESARERMNQVLRSSKL